MSIIFRSLLASLLLYSCSEAPEVKEKKASEPSLKLPSELEIQAIKSKYPRAVPYKQGIDSLINHLKQFGIQPNLMLWGQATCVDDITNTKDKLLPDILGPFNFGGLAGLAFTGITGLNAFVHHVPEHGSAVLFICPHIGYNQQEGWGKILRHDQEHASSCCGALSAALQNLQKNLISSRPPNKDDYQEGIIEQLALAHRKEILSSPEPLIHLTALISHEANRQMQEYTSKVKERHFKYAVVVSGFIINTDYMFTDYLSIEKVSILDIYRNEWIEGGKMTDSVTQ
jgi:hypothetical protein